MKKLPYALAILALLSPMVAMSADKPASSSDDIYTANKSVEIEVVRLLLGGNPSPNITAIILDAEGLLRRVKEAPSDQKVSLRSQLDAAIARLEMETANLKTTERSMQGH
jgi:TolA-binding protein